MLGTQHDGSMNIEQLLAIRTGSQNSIDLNDMAKRLPYQVTLYVADTDYENYLATYSCIHIPGYSNIIYGWVLSRTNTMSDEKYAELNDLLVNKVGVPSDVFGPIIQKDCKYWSLSPQ
ncbi:uncharacterized protein LOC107361410 isoform X2 [Tetranychus urticae]|nr:uncharacterized protein LOC107361410 isoform X2 [Tetranychus urticae]